MLSKSLRHWDDDRGFILDLLSTLMLYHWKLLPSSFLVEIDYISCSLAWANIRRAKISSVRAGRIYVWHNGIPKTIRNCSWIHKWDWVFGTWSEKSFFFLNWLESLREIKSSTLLGVSWGDGRSWVRKKSWLIIIRCFSNNRSQPFFSYWLVRLMKMIISRHLLILLLI